MTNVRTDRREALTGLVVHRGETSVRDTLAKTLIFYYWDLEECFEDVDASVRGGEIDAANDIYGYINHLILLDHDFVQEDEAIYIYDRRTIFQALELVIAERTGQAIYPALVAGWIRTLIERHRMEPNLLEEVRELFDLHDARRPSP